jgi:hypothetical protein
MSKTILIQILTALSFPLKFQTLDWEQLNTDKLIASYSNNHTTIYRAFDLTYKYRVVSQDWYRRALIHVLVHLENLRDEPTTFSLLQRIATEQQFSDVVRNEAIFVLTQHFPEQAATSLQQIAMDKTNHIELRYHAVLGLSETMSWLQEITVDTQLPADVSYQIRTHALYTFSFFQNRLEIFYYLKQIITKLHSSNHQDLDVYRWEIFELAMAILAHHARINCEARSFLWQMATQQQQTDSLREAAIRVLAVNFGKDPEVLNLVLEFLANKRISYHTKTDLINELCSFTQYIHEHLEILPLIWQTIIDKPSSHFDEVDDACLIPGLVSHFHEHPATLSGLQAMVRKQLSITKTELEKLGMDGGIGGYDVQCDAIDALAKHFHDHPETLSLIQQVLTQHQMPDSVRCNVIAILIEHYSHRTAEILPLLEEIAIDELTPDEMRGYVIQAVVTLNKRQTRR